MSLFTTNDYNTIDQEALRTYTLKKLNESRQKVNDLTSSNSKATFWHKLNDYIATNTKGDQKKDYQKVYSQLYHLPNFIEGWINTAVDSQERLEFFVRSKAAEIASGDQQNDYYWAMRIRHDQLVGLIRILEHLIDHLERWSKMKASEVLEDPVFQGLTSYDLEEQVYLEAENVHKERQPK